MMINNISYSKTPYFAYTTKNERYKSQAFDRGTTSFTSKNILTNSNTDLIRIVEKTVFDSKNFIGQGGEGFVFRIPKTNYCIKIPKCSEEAQHLKSYGSAIIDKIKKIWSFDISPKDKVNHVVAKCQDGKTIMKYIEGEKLNRFLKQKEIYDLPDTAYIDFMKQIENAKKYERGFDYAPQNVIFNKDKKTLTIIDFYDRCNTKWRSVHICPYTLKDTFKVLKSYGEETQTIKDNNKKLGGKLLNIIVDELSSKQKTDFEIKENDMSLLFEQIINSQDYNVNMKKYNLLKNSLYKMLDLHENFSQNKNKLDKAAKRTKQLIKEELT